MNIYESDDMRSLLSRSVLVSIRVVFLVKNSLYLRVYASSDNWPIGKIHEAMTSRTLNKTLCTLTGMLYHECSLRYKFLVSSV